MTDGWPALLVILAIFGASWVLVGPRGNVPVIDDWVYAWSVEHLLRTGQLRVLDISAFYPIVQILWGALFARVFGFSFVVLHVSTAVAAAVGCWCLYLTMRELGCRRRTGLLAAVALACHPLYFALSFSFMTEVPFIACSTLALFWYVRAIQRDSSAALWAGGVCAIAAFLIRPIGIVLPLAAMPALIHRAGGGLTVRRGIAALLATLLVMIALQAALPRILGPLDWAEIRGSYLQWWFMVPLASYLRWTLEVVVIAVFPMTPLLLAYATRWRRAVVTSIGALTMAFTSWAFGYVVRPVPDWQTWSLQDIAARAMLPGDVTPSRWSIHLMPLVTGLGVFVVGAVLAIAAQHLVRRGGWRRVHGVLVALSVLQVGCIHALWLYNDRYYVVLAPLVIIAAAAALDDDNRGQGVAVAFLIPWAVVGITGTRDMLAFNEAVAQAAQALEATGIPPWDIDAGYALNGWRLYAHPEHLPPAANRRYDVPFVTSEEETRYVISNTVPPRSDVLQVVPLPRSWWQATDKIYVLRRQ